VSGTEEENDGVTAPVAESTEPQAPEASAATAEGVAPAEPAATGSGAPDEAYKLAHLVGVSAPEDRYQSPGGGDQRDLAALAAMGVEPDSGPGRGLMIGSILLFVSLAVLGGVLIEAFEVIAAKRARAVASVVDDRLPAMEAEAATLLSTYAAIEGSAGVYRIAVGDAVASLSANPDLLATHPLGTPSEMALPEGIEPPPPPPAPVFTPGMTDPVTGFILLAPGVPCIPGTGAVLPPPVIDDASGLPLPGPELPLYDPSTCVVTLAEGSGAAAPEGNAADGHGAHGEAGDSHAGHGH
jgi:hypothetical protein